MGSSHDAGRYTCKKCFKVFPWETSEDFDAVDAHSVKCTGKKERVRKPEPPKPVPSAKTGAQLVYQYRIVKPAKTVQLNYQLADDPVLLLSDAWFDHRTGPFSKAVPGQKTTKRKYAALTSSSSKTFTYDLEWRTVRLTSGALESSFVPKKSS